LLFGIACYIPSTSNSDLRDSSRWDLALIPIAHYLAPVEEGSNAGFLNITVSLSQIKLEYKFWRNRRLRKTLIAAPIEINFTYGIKCELSALFTCEENFPYNVFRGCSYKRKGMFVGNFEKKKVPRSCNVGVA